MKRNLTELVFILDRSGSMAGLEEDTIGGFNSMIERQKALDGTAYVSTVLFDNTMEVIHDRVSLHRIAPLTRRDYYVRGSTALMDAIGDAIHHIAMVHKYARPQDVPEHTMFIIITDGHENASRRYTCPEVRAMIEKEKKQYGWQFLFIGANIDAEETAESFGIDRQYAANYRADSIGTEKVYRNVSNAVENVRCCAPLGSAWKKDLEEDLHSR